MMDYLRIGLVTKPQGIKGELKLEILGDYPERFDGLKEVFVESRAGYERRSVVRSAVRSGAAYVMLEGIQDRNAAEELRGAYLCVRRENAVKLPEGRYFVCDLIGCRVFDTQGRSLGELKDVFSTPANDVYVIEGEKDCMVPAIKKLLAKVDTQSREILFDAKVFEEVAVWDED
jgi:16S rRNA processing protein RimM